MAIQHSPGDRHVRNRPVFVSKQILHALLQLLISFVAVARNCRGSVLERGLVDVGVSTISTSQTPLTSSSFSLSPVVVTFAFVIWRRSPSSAFASGSVSPRTT